MKTIILKELKGNLLTLKGYIWFIIASVLLSILSYLFLINNELSLLDQKTMVYYLMEAILLLGIFRAVISGCDSFAGEIERGTMEVLQIIPLKKSKIAFAKLIESFLNWSILFMISIPYIWVVSKQGKNIFLVMTYLFLFGSMVIILFLSLSIILSIIFKNVKNAIMIGILTFLFFGTTIILPASMKESWIGKAFDFINPLAAAVNTFDSVVIDNEGFNFQVPRLLLLIVYSLATLFLLTRISENRELYGEVQ